jgi:5-methyltetrahydropteroyltriglutamate--homocysteine methyltransferase
VRQLLRDRGDDWQDLLRIYVDAINAVVGAAPPEMKVAIHVCRSQDPSWQADTGYDPIAEALFDRIKLDTYLLEYDNPRSGTFEPLRLLPKGKQAVLGLVASRSGTLETADFLKRRIDEAARYTGLDQLGISPHCGFSTSARPADDTAFRLEREKLKLVVDVARAVWGG